MTANGDFGILFETEADTLVGALKKEWGNFSDVLRRAFHHEPIDSQRKKDDEYIFIKNPHLSVVLSGTPNQVSNLIDSIENGLFSRFIFYWLPSKNEWRNVFSKDISDTDITFLRLSKETHNFYASLRKKVSNWKDEQVQDFIEFTLADEQQKKFNNWFRDKQSEIYDLYGDEMLATVRRLGLITFRISMILSAVRLMRGTKTISQQLICEDLDFNTANLIVDSLLSHASAVYNHLKTKRSNSSTNSRRENYFDCLPDNFNRMEADAAAEALGVNLKTAEKYLSDWAKSGRLIHSHNNYKKKDT